jgi:hypothetical protein
MPESRRFNMEKDLSMYDSDEQVQVKQPFGRPTISIIKAPMTTTIKIGDQEIQVINPKYVEDLRNQLIQMSNKIKKLESDISSVNSNNRNRDMMVRDLRSQLESKVDRA